MQKNISVWEEEGGALPRAIDSDLTGTVNQIEWAARIREQVNDEFDRVAGVLNASALRQSEKKRSSTHSIVAILEKIRTEVLANGEAGYFIHDWQEHDGRVRKMLLADSRYKAVKAG